MLSDTQVDLSRGGDFAHRMITKDLFLDMMSSAGRSLGIWHMDGSYEMGMESVSEWMAFKRP